jgi:hypothetical protein
LDYCAARAQPCLRKIATSKDQFMIPATSGRVPQHTPEQYNQQIQQETQQRLAYYRHTSPAEIEHRLEELDQEWDIERTLEANAATLAFTGCLLAATTHRRWILLPMVVTGFLLQHAIQGWCPPAPLFRRFGFRTMREIDEERFALKLMRGDFDQHTNSGDAASADAILSAVQR